MINPTAMIESNEAFQGWIKDTSLKAAEAIEQLEAIQAPNIFANLHKMYLKNMTLIKDLFKDMLNPDAVISQPRLDELKILDTELLQELGRIFKSALDASAFFASLQMVVRHTLRL